MIYFVTSNKGKFAEAKGIFANLEQRNIGYTEIQADTLEEVAAFGIMEVMKRLQCLLMIEDAGLFIPPLKGFPALLSLRAKDHWKFRHSQADAGAEE
jgi:XTP/dITP diphosphohydrolase